MDRRAQGRANVSRAVLLVVVLLGGCGAVHHEPEDASGVVVMGPHLTEFVYALGQGERVVAVGNYSDYPPAVEALPRVGGYIDPDLEKLTLLDPAVLLLAGVYPKVTDFAAQRGIRVVNINMDSFGGIDAGIARLGEALDCVGEADALRARMQREIEALRTATADLPPVPALILTGRAMHNLDTLHTVGRSSFVSEMVALAGGRNVYHDEDTAYFEASKETVVVRAPEAIIEFHAGEQLSSADEVSFLRDWNALPALPAVQEGRILLVTAPHALRPGPRIVGIARRIAAFLHPTAELPQ